MALPMWLRSDRFRRIVALVCFFTVDALVIITLAITTSHPSSALSWTTLTGNNDSLNFGLTNYRACTNDRTLEVQGWDFGLNGCQTAGAWVIASYIVTLVLSIVPLFMMLHNPERCGCIRVPYPRLVGTAASFAVFVWTVVAVSKWFEGCHSNVYCANDNCSKKPGYAIALAILIVVLAFVGMVFYWWRVIRPQPGGAMQGKPGGFVDGNAETSDGYGETQPGGQFAGYSSPSNAQQSGTYSMGMAALSNPQVQQWGMAAAQNPQMQQYAMQAAQNPQVQQWGAQQVKSSYGY